jgi:multidrug transporter EmrE-like cation transporter
MPRDHAGDRPHERWPGPIPGDESARARRARHPVAEAFLSWWFVGYVLVRTLATFGQLWVLSKLVLGRALPMFAASSVVLSILHSVTVLNEGLTTQTLVGGGLAVAALVALTP